MTEPNFDLYREFTGDEVTNHNIVQHFTSRSSEERLAELLDLYGNICDDARYLLRKHEMRGSRNDVSVQRDIQRDYADSLSITLRRFTYPLPLGQELSSGAVAGRLSVAQVFERRNYHARFRNTNTLAWVGLRLFDEFGSPIDSDRALLVEAPQPDDDEVAIYFGGRDMKAMHGLLQGIRSAKGRAK